MYPISASMVIRRLERTKTEAVMTLSSGLESEDVKKEITGTRGGERGNSWIYFPEEIVASHKF